MSKYEPRLPYYEIQRQALRKGWNKPGFGYLLEMGLGKSKILIDNICILREFGTLRRALIIAPMAACGNWYRKELPEHVPERVQRIAKILLWRGGRTDYERSMVQWLSGPDAPPLSILIVNIEAISAVRETVDVCRRFVEAGRCLVAVDESQQIKNHDSKRTEKIIALGRMAEFRRIMTGTEVTKWPLDVYSQFEFLYERCLGSGSFFGFRKRYAITRQVWVGGGASGGDPDAERKRRKITMVDGYRDLDSLTSLMEPHCIIAKKADCLDLPPKVRSRLEVELTSKQEEMYREIQSYGSAEIDGQYVSYKIAAGKVQRLHQVVCGHVTTESGEHREVPCNKLSVFEQYAESVSSPTIVWCAYLRDVQRVVEKLESMGRRVVRYDGSVSERDRAAAIYRFQGQYGGLTCPDGELADWFVGTPNSGGRAITLTRAKNVLYYSYTDDLELRLQSEDRAHRIGQTGTVVYTDLVAPGTVEDGILHSLMEKKSLADIIAEGPARFREVYGRV